MTPAESCQLATSCTMNSGLPCLVVRARSLAGSRTGSGLLATWNVISEVSIGNRMPSLCRQNL
jgi:hypothetical protein